MPGFSCTASLSPLKVMTMDKHLQINSSFFPSSLSKRCNVVFCLSAFFFCSLYLLNSEASSTDSYLSKNHIFWLLHFDQTVGLPSDRSKAEDNKSFLVAVYIETYIYIYMCVCEPGRQNKSLVSIF